MIHQKIGTFWTNNRGRKKFVEFGIVFAV